MVKTINGNTVDLEVGGDNVTLSVSKYFSSITVNDNKEGVSDSFTLTLNDPRGEIVKPSRFKTMSVFINGVNKGDYEINSIGGNIHNTIINISGTSIPMSNSLRKPTSNSFTDISLEKLSDTIAKKNGLQSVVDVDLKGIIFDQINQVKESDLNLLSRLASDQSASMKVTKNHIVITKRDVANKVNGDALPIMPINDPSVTNGSWEEKSSEASGTIKASWLNENTNLEVYEKDGEGEPVTELPDRYATKKECIAAIKSARGKSDKSEISISLTIPLNVYYIAGCQAEIKNHTSIINGICEIESFSHTVSVSGYDMTSIKMVKKK